MTYTFTASGQIGEYEVQAEVEIEGRYRKATQIDPEELPEIDVVGLTLVRRRSDATGYKMVKRERPVPEKLFNKLAEKLLDEHYHDILQAAAERARERY